jgi:hypothetical protein
MSSRIIKAYTPLKVADFSWVNQSTTTATDNLGGIDLYSPATSSVHNLHCLVKSTPSTPYRVITNIKLIPHPAYTAYTAAGMCWRESSSGKIVTLLHFTLGTGRQAMVIYPIRMTNATTYSGEDATTPGWSQDWMMMEDTGSTRNVYISNDGFNWTNIYSKSRTDFCTPDQIGICTDPYNLSCYATVNSWKVETAG